MGISVPSQREPRASGLYKIVTRNCPLSASGKSKAQKSHRVTRSRLVEALSTNLLRVTRCDFCALLLPDADSGQLRVTILYNPEARGSLCDGTRSEERRVGKECRCGGWSYR